MSLFDRVVATITGFTHEHALAKVERLREKYPNENNAQITRRLRAQYIRNVTISGAGSGGTAAIPAVGTPVALTTAIADIGFFMEETVRHVLCVAAAQDYPALEDDEVRKYLVLTTLMGNSSSGFVTKAAGRTGSHLGRKGTQKVSVETLRQINAVLGRNFVTKYGTKQGILVLGKTLPFGIGAGIGAGGNALVATATAKTALKVIEAA